jgi:hypothetical protein
MHQTSSSRFKRHAQEIPLTVFSVFTFSCRCFLGCFGDHSFFKACPTKKARIRVVSEKITSVYQNVCLESTARTAILWNTVVSFMEFQLVVKLYNSGFICFGDRTLKYKIQYFKWTTDRLWRSIQYLRYSCGITSCTVLLSSLITVLEMGEFPGRNPVVCHTIALIRPSKTKLN